MAGVNWRLFVPREVMVVVVVVVASKESWSARIQTASVDRVLSMRDAMTIK